MPPAVHVLMSFASADDASTAMLTLTERGVLAGCYTPAQMRRSASLGALGLPLHLLATLRDLARHGHSIVAAHVAGEPMVAQVEQLAHDTHAYSAHSCGRFRVRELIAPPRPARRRRALPLPPVIASSMPPGRWQTAARPSTAL